MLISFSRIFPKNYPLLTLWFPRQKPTKTVVVWVYAHPCNLSPLIRAAKFAWTKQTGSRCMILFIPLSWKLSSKGHVILSHFVHVAANSIADVGAVSYRTLLDPASECFSSGSNKWYENLGGWSSIFSHSARPKQSHEGRSQMSKKRDHYHEELRPCSIHSVHYSDRREFFLSLIRLAVTFASP